MSKEVTLITEICSICECDINSLPYNGPYSCEHDCHYKSQAALHQGDRATRSVKKGETK